MKSKTAKKELPPMVGSDACVCMHTALRKRADSSITSAAYNLIHVICDTGIKPTKFDPWRLYGDLVAGHINDPKTSDQTEVHACQLAHGALERVWSDIVMEHRKKEHPSPIPNIARPCMYALYTTMKCFDQDDWEAMAEYLKEEEGSY